MAIIKTLIFLGYLNWFFTVGLSAVFIIKGRRDRLYILRALVTLFIPWIGGIIYWIFPIVVGYIQKISYSSAPDMESKKKHSE